MSDLLHRNEDEVREVIEKNNSLIRKKGSLQLLLEDKKTQNMILTAIQKRNEWATEQKDKKYIKLLELLSKNHWSLDKSIDEIIKEPLGGAHHDYHIASENLKESILRNINELSEYSTLEMLKNRKYKYDKIGSWIENE